MTQKHLFFIMALLNCYIHVVAINVRLIGPRYVRRGDDIIMSCVSDVPPSDQTAEFLVNGETVTYLIKRENGCVSTGTKCDLDECRCSNDGKTFTLRLKSIQNEGSIGVRCSMKFKTNRSFFLNAKKLVTILDIIGPSISTREAFPLIAGTYNQLLCSVETKHINITLLWDCLNITTTRTEHYNNTFVLLSRIKIKFEFHGETCSCIARYNNFTTKSSLILIVSNPPLIEADTYKVCNASSAVVLDCVLYGDLKTFGFNPWFHIVNGFLIRQISGTNVGNSSSIHIKSCSFQDSGEYICNAWNKIKNITYFSNATTELRVNDGPIVVKTDTYDVPTRVMSVQYYALEQDVIVRWYTFDAELQNSTPYTITNARNQLSLDIYGKAVKHNGYIANLSINDTSYGRYTVVLSNTFGETRHAFNLTSNNTIFHIRSVFWVLTGVIVFVLMVGVMSGILIKFRHTQMTMSMTNSNRGKNRTAIYYAAPEDENNVHTYNLTDPHYIEVDLPNSDVPSEYAEIIDDINQDSQFDTNHDYLDVIS